MIREKIAEILAPDVWGECSEMAKDSCRLLAWEILTLLKGEIKKAALTEKEIWAAYRADMTDGVIRAIAKAQLQKIIKALEEK